MNKLIIVSAICTSLALSGCVISVDGDSHSSSWHSSEKKNREYLSQLQLDTTYEHVLNKMGVADFSELYKINDDQYRVLYYRTQRMEGDGITTKEECTPLVFKNGIIEGWGDSAYSLIPY